MLRRRFGYAGGGRWVVFVVALFGVALMATSTPVQADTFNLTSCHFDPSSGCGAAGTIYGTVTLTQAGANVNFDVVLSGTNRFVETGSVDQQLFKFNGVGVAATDIVNAATGMPLNAVPGGLQGSAGAFNGDGTGAFGFGINCVTSSNCNGGSTPTFREITFTVNNATIAELTVPNNSGNLFVADVLFNGATGPIDVNTGAIPEPTTLLMAGTALVGLGVAWRRRRSQEAKRAALAV